MILAKIHYVNYTTEIFLPELRFVFDLVLTPEDRVFRPSNEP